MSETLRLRIAVQAALSFIEGVRYVQGPEAETKHVAAAAERHRQSVLDEIEGKAK